MSNFGPSSDKMDTSVIDKIRESSRRQMHIHVKRDYSVGVSCEKCKKFHIQSTVSIGYCCPACGKYNNVSEAHKRYEAGDVDYGKDNRFKGGAPSIKTSEGRDYTQLRDEHEIRADFFVNGKTRDSMGFQKFDKELKSELKKNKCYRGDASNVG